MANMTEPPEDAEPWQREAWKHMDKIGAEFARENVAWGHVSMDPEEFEAAIQHACDEYERRMGVRPTMIDLPNWTRGTILEQVAFINGFDIAPRRKE